MTIRIDGTNTAANPGITGTDTDTGLQFGTDEVNIVTGGSTRATVDSSGRLLVNTTTSDNVGSTVGALVQTRFSGSFTNFAATRESGPAVIAIGRANGSAAQIVSSGDEIGAIRWAGADGNDLETQAATISAFVDGTPGANDMPGRLVFSTTATGSTPTERMRITSTGDLRFNSGYGSVATAYGVRAWVNFNGSNTVAIRQSGNVSSITDNGTGVYQVNFTNSMPDDSYSVAGTATWSSANYGGVLLLNGSTGGISSDHVWVATVSNTNTAAIDPLVVTVLVIR